MKLTPNQLIAVRNLSIILNKKATLWFQAPTGSGKTFILANFINNLIKEYQYKNQKVVFILASVSTGNIHEQNYIKFVKYKNLNKNLIYQNYLIKSPSKNAKAKKDLEYDIPKLNNCVYFLGTSAFRSKTLLKEKDYLEDLTRILKNQNYTIIYIRDEAHLGTKKPKSSTLDDFILRHSDKQVYLTATPPKEQIIDVKMTISQAIADNLIKSKRVQNNLRKIEDYDNIASDELLKAVCEEFIEIRKQYNEFNIRPALLIQIGSKNQLTGGIEKIIYPILKRYNLSYAVWTSDIKFSSQNIFDNSITKENLQKELTDHNSIHDVIIFKVALATGWDIPRACMLLQLRDIDSDQLNEQTIGRIRRNPLINLEKNSITDKYYIYSNYQDNDKTRENIPVIIKNKQSFKNQDFRTYRFKTKPEIITIKAIDLTVTKLVEHYEQKIGHIDSEINNYLLKPTNYKKDQWYLTNFKLVDDVSLKTFNYVTKFSNQFDIYIFWNNNISGNLLLVLNKFLDIFAKKHKIAEHLLMLYILKSGTEMATSFYTNSLEESVENKFINKLEKLPEKSYVLNNSDYCVRSINTVKYQNIHKAWPYDQFTDKNKDAEIYPQESMSETYFLKYFILYNGEKEFEIITKNYIVNSNIYHEYLREWKHTTEDIIFKKISNMYPDYIIKYKNHVYYIEVKSAEMDYDKQKTESIAKYYNLFANDESNKDGKYIYCIVWTKVGQIKKNYTTGIFKIIKFQNGNKPKRLYSLKQIL